MFSYSSRHKYFKVFLVIFFTKIIVCVPSYACENADAPNILLRDLTSDMISSINNNYEKIKNDSTIATILIEDILLPHADFLLASKRVLASKWGKLSKQQKRKFVRVFQIFLIRQSSVILADFLTNQDKKINTNIIEFDEPYFSANTIATVKSTVFSDSGRNYTVAYGLHCNKSLWQIYDVVIDGVSVIKLFQKDFERKIERDGFDSLVVYLNHKNDVLLAYKME